MSARHHELPAVIGNRETGGREPAAGPSTLHQADTLLVTALESIPHGVCIYDANLRTIVGNRAYAEFCGLTPGQTKPGTRLQEILDARAAAGHRRRTPERRAVGSSAEARFSEPDHFVNELGNGRVVAVSRHPLPGGGLIEVHRDITDLDVAVAHAAAAQQELIEKQYAIDQAVIVAITDLKGRITYANENFCRISGYARDELLGQDHRVLNSGTHSKSFFRDMYRQIARGHVWRGELCNRAKDGTTYWVDTVISPQLGPSGRPIAYMAIRIDITARKLAEAQIVYAARHDALTGAANRAVLLEKMQEALDRLHRQGEPFAILILDLDGFKDINDTLGHAAGDKVLKELALRLQSLLGETDCLARLGGDEFAIVRSCRADPRQEAIALAETVLQTTANPFDIDGQNVSIGTSIGIALAPDDGIDEGGLLKKADLALYRVKSEGRNGLSVFDSELTKDATSRLQMINELRAAIARSEFDLHYQPVLDARTRRLYGAEALVRWRHPRKGLISPDHFIWLAEETGLIEPLGEWVLRRACTDAAAWPEDIRVAVNLSAAQFRTGKLFDIIVRALADSGLPPERLELEVTESLLLNNSHNYQRVIRQFKDIGITIALDDFGTGYSSLSCLTTFPFDRIKIDKSFTQGIPARADCTAVVASVLTLARGLDMVVTAEGVETEHQFELLRAAGVHQVQGFLFGRPVPVSELEFPGAGLRAREVA
jgi:diguanylate cyclase (GGDEF)-like protein/PAS domain S-box-containing protein